MTKYLIENKVSGATLGEYEGENEAEALEACARDAGYKSFADQNSVIGSDGSDIVVTLAK
jgi:hypothetical protein